MTTRFLVLVTTSVLLAPPDLWAGGFVVAQNGESKALIYAPGETEWAGVRLADRVRRWTGVSVPVHSKTAVYPGNSNLIAVGVPGNNPVVRESLGADPRLADLGDQGYILKVTTWRGRPVLIAAGRTLAGVNNGVSELVSWKLRFAQGRAAARGDLDESDKPALKYRMLWSAIGAAWAPTFQETIAVVNGEVPNRGASTGEGVLEYCKRAIDYCSDHKLNGFYIYYLIDEKIGGLATAQEVCRYARHNNVRIILGVATMSSYHGFAVSPDFEFTFKNWNAQRPQLSIVHRDGKSGEGICPSKPENQEWLRRGTRWLFEHVPDLGGVNVEDGDWILCWCDDCRAARNDPGNDPNFFHDQMASYRPVLEEMDRLGLDAWQTFATYSGFSKNAIKGAMYGAIQTKRAEGPSTRIVYPPRFLQQMPPRSIAQWTVTGMVTPGNWPEGQRPPRSNFKEHIGFFHQGSPWWGPVKPQRWWADKGPGSMWDDISQVLHFVIGRVHSSGMVGMTVKGMAGDSAPARDIGYVALEYFGWHPERSYEQFVQDRLSVRLGGEERAREFLRMLRNTTQDPAAVERDRQLAEKTANDADLDPRQRLRWRNLVRELARRATLARERAAAQRTQANERSLYPTSAQDGYVVLASGHLDTASGFLRWGKQGGSRCVVIGIHTLPFGKTTPDVVNAKLRIPLTDTPVTDDSSARRLSVLIQHIDAADDMRVTVPDGASPPLGHIGVYRAPGPLNPEFNKYIELDVTEQVKADLKAQRATFAWRIEPETVPNDAPSQLSFPSVDCVNSSFPKDNHGARLLMRFQAMVGSEENNEE